MGSRIAISEELLVSSLAQTEALAKLLIEKGLNHPRRVHAEDFRGTGDVSEVTESQSAMNIGEILIVRYLFGNPQIYSC